MKHDKYYYPTGGVLHDTCLQECAIKTPIRIGSAKCKECENCLSFNTEESWIVCKQIDLAIKENKTT